MNIQIFGKNKCFETKKAIRYFKERRVKYQYRDLKEQGLSGREFDAVLLGCGGVENLIDYNGKSEQILLMKYMDDIRVKEDKVFENPLLMKTPIVRNGRQVTVGYCPDVWATWE